MRRLRLARYILRETGADVILLSFAAFMLICALLFWLCDPGIENLGAGIWYCFTVVSTIGFGDVVVKTNLSRILSMILSIYGVVVMAIFTGVIVNYFNQVVQQRQNRERNEIFDQFERLPELSREEVKKLSARVQKWRRSMGDR